MEMADTSSLRAMFSEKYPWLHKNVIDDIISDFGKEDGRRIFVSSDLSEDPILTLKTSYSQTGAISDQHEKS